MKRILVTGASGFIGERFCSYLQEQSTQVRILSHQHRSISSDYFLLDLAKDSCPVELCSGIETVFHLAGKAHALAENQQDANEYFQINTEGTRKLLEAAKQAGVQKFIYFSSVKAVGDSDIQPMDESVASLADTPYGQSKYAAEQLVLHGGYVPHPVVIRPSMVYGATEKGNLPQMIKAVAKGLFPPLPETKNRRSMVYVDDVVNAAILAAECPQAAGQIYIVTERQSYSTRQLYDWIREALGKQPVDWSVPYPLLDVLAKSGDVIGALSRRRFPLDSDALQKLTGSAWYSSAKIERELGFRPQHTLRQALPDIVRYLQSR